MLKKVIKYEDYDGNEREDTLYFNLTKAELMDWELSQNGGLSTRLKEIVASKKVPEIAAIFKEIIRRSYGVKSPDGKRFMKNKELLDEFVESPAYSELYMELATDEKAATNFINAVIPKVPNPNEVPG